MITRFLEPSEWHRLKGTEAESVIPFLETLQARVMVIEAGAEIVGCWVFYPMWHADCLWIADAHRGRGGVARRLLVGMRAFLHSVGAGTLWTGSMAEDVTHLLQRFGAKEMPGEHFVMGVQ